MNVTATGEGLFEFGPGGAYLGYISDPSRACSAPGVFYDESGVSACTLAIDEINSRRRITQVVLMGDCAEANISCRIPHERSHNGRETSAPGAARTPHAGPNDRCHWRIAKPEQ